MIQQVPTYIISASGEGGSTNNFLTMFSDDMCQIDAGMADQQFHTNPPILQANETCEIAFKGRRDLVLFTTKRILFVDKQGWSGKKMAYITFPYSSIKIFNVATAGTMDRDCEFGFYTEVWFDPPKCNGCENGCGKFLYIQIIHACIFFLNFFGLSSYSLGIPKLH